MSEGPRIPSHSPSSTVPLSAIDYNQQTAKCGSSDWTATKTLPDPSHATPSYLSRRTGPDSSASTTPPPHPTDVGHPMAALLEEDDLLFEVDFDTETLQQMHDLYEKDRFPSDDKIQALAAQTAGRMESTEEGGSPPDEAELQRRIREWFSKERSKDAKNGKVSAANLVKRAVLNDIFYSHYRHQERCHQSTILSARGACYRTIHRQSNFQCRLPLATSDCATATNHRRRVPLHAMAPAMQTCHGTGTQKP